MVYNLPAMYYNMKIIQNATTQAIKQFLQMLWTIPKSINLAIELETSPLRLNSLLLIMQLLTAFGQPQHTLESSDQMFVFGLKIKPRTKIVFNLFFTLFPIWFIKLKN